MAYGRRRAAARLEAGNYAPHPGWRHFVDAGWRVLVDQGDAMRRVAALVDAEDWRADKRSSWLQILRQLVCCMDWSTGLVAAVTADKLGEAGDRAPRTVSRVIAWARDVGLVVVVEHAASREFLGTPHGRTPTYALVTDQPVDPPGPAPQESSPAAADGVNPQLRMDVDESGDLSTSCVQYNPLRGKRLEPTGQPAESWPVFRVPLSPSERTLATKCLLQRLGLDRGRVSGVPLFRARAQLKQWWEAGACPAGLLHALHHHPDRQDHHRGDMLRGARDPLGILGHRLRPWNGRLAELPLAVVGIRGDYQAAQSQRIQAAAEAAQHSLPQSPCRTTRSAAQSQAKAALAAHLARLRDARRGRSM